MISTANLEQTVIDGVSTRVQRVADAGTPGVPPALVLHGWGAHIEAVAPIVASLAAHTTVIAPDFPGFGESSPPAEAWGVDDYARFTTSLARHYELERYTIVAHSFGARVAICLAAGGPAAIERMLLTGAAGIKPRRRPSYYGKVALAKAGRVAALAGGRRGRDLQSRIRSRVASADWLAVPEAMRTTLRQVLGEDLTARLPDVAVPTLLVWGEDDADTPLWMGQKMAELMGDAALVTIPGAGHYAYADRPGHFNAVLERFLVDQLRDGDARG